jgi:hypothetical protein
MPTGKRIRNKNTFQKITDLIKDECANYDSVDGTCLHIGNDCPCVQMISKCSFQDKGILMCKYFRDNVLPLDADLNIEINKNLNTKKCAVCNKPILAKSNRSKYCDDCQQKIRRKQYAESKQKNRTGVHN